MRHYKNRRGAGCAATATPRALGLHTIMTAVWGGCWNNPLPLTLLSAVVLASSCGGGGSSTSTPTPTPAISVSPTSATVVVKGTQQFTPTVTNASSTLVNWQVNSVAGGDATHGTISTSGLYTAPSAVPTGGNVVTITAVSQAISTLTATASVTINPAPTFSVSPTGTNAAPVVVRAGDTQPFTITVSGGSSVPVTWEVNGQIGGTSTIGTITQQGNYIAPQIPPPGALVTITAVSQADSTHTASAVVQVMFSNFSLSGSYVFSTRGAITTTGGFINRVGSFTATSQTSTGTGSLSVGLEDINQSTGQPNPNTPTSFSGTYSIMKDGRGTMEFCETSPSSCPPGAVTATFQIVVISAQQVQMIEFDSFATGTGEMDLQDVSAFNAGLSGIYSFDLSGISSIAAGAQHPGSWVGEFSANGAGGISSGETDLNDGGTLSQPQIQSASSYAANAAGRGTATFNTSTGTFNLIFYIVSAARVKFLERDALPALVGDAFKQQQTPGVPWANSSLFCSTPPCAYVFEVGGASGATGSGLFQSDGNGNLVASSGLIDRNRSGTVTAGTLAGTYSIDANGRGTAPLTAIVNGVATPVIFVFYMISTGMAVLQETDAGNVADGPLLLQQGGPFTAASLQGSYALNLAGVAGATPENFVGQITADGAGKVASGSLDININDFAPAGQPLVRQLSGELVTGTYTSVGAPGRATMNLNPSADNRNFVLYFVSPAHVIVLGADSTRVAAGAISKQF